MIILQIKIIPERDIIWFAGIVDGEASIYIRKQKKPGNDVYSLELEISMTDKPTIQKIHDIFEFGSFRPAKRKKQKEHHRQAWKICYSSNMAEAVIRTILPYLITKKEEALLALEFADMKRSREGRGSLSFEEMMEREWYYEKMKELKKKEFVITEVM